MTPDESYIYHERLSILIQGTREPTPEEVKLAEADVQRFKIETGVVTMKEQELFYEKP